MSRQVAPPESMGINTIMLGDQRDFYGFDFFQVDRVIDSGAPPDGITFVEHHADSAEIAARLTENSYTATELDNGWTLYSILDDYEMSLAGDLPRVGQLGQRNRIALRENQMIIARATDNVLRVVETQTTTALVADPAYAAAALALDDPLLADTGELIGVLTLDEPVLEDAARFMLGERATPENVEKMREQLKASGWAALPVYDLAAFATRHAEGATYLIVVVVFPPGVDSLAAADELATRMQTYISGRYEAGLQDRWAFDRAAGIDVNGCRWRWRSCARTIRRPPWRISRCELRRPGVDRLVFARDFGFLAVGDNERDRIAELLKMFNETARLARSLGLRLSFTEDRRAVIDMPYNPDYDHALGGVHGGVYMTLLDSAAWFTSAAAHDESIWVATSELTVHLLKPVIESDLRAVGRIIQSGRRQDSRHLYDGSGQLAVHGVGSRPCGTCEQVEEVR
jgi:uncharacterized protein (TIGR00369 family)